jgi:hypothetical protein
LSVQFVAELKVCRAIRFMCWLRGTRAALSNKRRQEAPTSATSDELREHADNAKTGAPTVQEYIFSGCRRDNAILGSKGAKGERQSKIWMTAMK